jgi:hypothetical protein
VSYFHRKIRAELVDIGSLPDIGNPLIAHGFDLQQAALAPGEHFFELGPGQSSIGRKGYNTNPPVIE